MFSQAESGMVSLKFIRLLRVVFSSQQRVTEGVITTRSNRMKFRLGYGTPTANARP